MGERGKAKVGCAGFFCFALFWLGCLILDD